MRIILYRLIIKLSRMLGSWVFAVFAWNVATGYYLFFPFRVRNSVRFYRILFPDRNGLFHAWCAWRQFHNFTDVFFNRFLLTEQNDITWVSEGFDNLEEACRRKEGGILLMSHMGNWEIAAHILMRKKQDRRLLLYMGVKYKEQLEGIQKKSISQSGVTIIAVDEEGGSPLDIIEGIKFIESGGTVSLTGDLVWKKGQRTVPVKFLGHEVRLPEAPYLLALLSGAPIFIFFAFRTGNRQYQCNMSKPIYIRVSSRRERTAAIQHAAQQYADILEETLRRHPLQWYHFEPFLDLKQP